jgi:hypothetical protein
MVFIIQILNLYILQDKIIILGQKLNNTTDGDSRILDRQIEEYRI